MDPSNRTDIVIIVGADGSSDSGVNAQCFVSVGNNGHVTAKTPPDICIQKFQTLNGCQAPPSATSPGNDNYNPYMVGGNINVQYGKARVQGQPVDDSLPFFALSVPKGMNAAGAAVHTLGSLTEETTTAASAGRNSNSNGGGNARGGNRGGSAGSGYVGEIL